VTRMFATVDYQLRVCSGMLTNDHPVTWDSFSPLHNKSGYALNLQCIIMVVQSSGTSNVNINGMPCQQQI